MTTTDDDELAGTYGRCDTCRRPVLAGGPSAHWPDGRVAHVTCLPNDQRADLRPWPTTDPEATTSDEPQPTTGAT
jgi:hypothetical protein